MPAHNARVDEELRCALVATANSRTDSRRSKCASSLRSGSTAPFHRRAGDRVALRSWNRGDWHRSPETGDSRPSVTGILWLRSEVARELAQDRGIIHTDSDPGPMRGKSDSPRPPVVLDFLEGMRASRQTRYHQNAAWEIRPGLGRVHCHDDQRSEHSSLKVGITRSTREVVVFRELCVVSRGYGAESRCVPDHPTCKRGLDAESDPLARGSDWCGHASNSRALTVPGPFRGAKGTTIRPCRWNLAIYCSRRTPPPAVPAGGGSRCCGTRSRCRDPGAGWGPASRRRIP